MESKRENLSWTAHTHTHTRREGGSEMLARLSVKPRKGAMQYSAFPGCSLFRAPGVVIQLDFSTEGGRLVNLEKESQLQTCMCEGKTQSTKRNRRPTW